MAEEEIDAQECNIIVQRIFFELLTIMFLM